MSKGSLDIWFDGGLVLGLGGYSSCSVGDVVVLLVWLDGFSAKELSVNSGGRHCEVEVKYKSGKE